MAYFNSVFRNNMHRNNKIKGDFINYFEIHINIHRYCSKKKLKTNLLVQSIFTFEILINIG